VMLEVRLVSQPLLKFPSQLPKPALQVMPHLLALQVAIPFVPLHTLPQAPQLVMLEVRLVSQPLLKFPSQLPKPALQVMPHAPALQVAVPFVPLHVLPQTPQLVMLELVLTQLLEQRLKPGLQVKPHMPALQVTVSFGPEGHTVPQAPQLLRSEAVFVQALAHVT